MSLTLSQVLPNLSGGLGGTGFIFGAGASVEAGYPMMADLTQQVVNRLTGDERTALDEVMSAALLVYVPSKGDPSIEVIADVVTAHALDTGQWRFGQLGIRLRELVTEIILSVTSPRLDNHVAFLTALKRRAFGRAVCVHVFTTNYDLLFELAGAESNVVIETGFVGSVERFFDHQRLTTACGTQRLSRTFEEHPVLTVRLIKLHGSVSWTTRGGKFFERHPASIKTDDQRVLVLPRKHKVLDTLQPPHDVLFGVASKALGNECKYLATCGFSFGDEHINSNLIVPAVASGKIRLFALCASETEGMRDLKDAPAFSAGFSTSRIAGGVSQPSGTDCWMFSRFVRLFE